jgi:hypothetical protein
LRVRRGRHGCSRGGGAFVPRKCRRPHTYGHAARQQQAAGREAAGTGDIQADELGAEMPRDQQEQGLADPGNSGRRAGTNQPAVRARFGLWHPSLTIITI